MSYSFRGKHFKYKESISLGNIYNNISPSLNSFYFLSEGYPDVRRMSCNVDYLYKGEHFIIREQAYYNCSDPYFNHIRNHDLDTFPLSSYKDIYDADLGSPFNLVSFSDTYRVITRTVYYHELLETDCCILACCEPNKYILV